MTDPQPILERILGLHPKLIDLSLDRVWKLLGELGAPHLKMPPVVHVSGTNGKGSVIAMMRAALEAAGYAVHAYTSPHLVRFNERIVLAGAPIDDGTLSALLEECEEANLERPITFFEITTAAAFLAFSRTPADILLLESGLGGRLDATNAIREAMLTVITPVSLDHQQYLGDELPGIAAEKAGILKSGVTGIVAGQAPEAMDAIAEKAAEVGAPLVVEGLDWTIRYGLETFVINSGGDIRELARPSLEGPHQAHNAGVAVAALERLAGFKVPDAAIAGGFRDVEWPARLERIRTGRLRAKLGQGYALYLDGGHNAAAADALARWLAERDPLPMHLVFGMLDSKDPAAFLAPLKPYIDSVRMVAIPGEAASLGTDALVSVAEELGLRASPAADIADALGDIKANEPYPARVLIAGSLYLAGSVLAENA